MILSDLIGSLQQIRALADQISKACASLQDELNTEVSTLDPVATMQQITSLQTQVTDLQAQLDAAKG